MTLNARVVFRKTQTRKIYSDVQCPAGSYVVHTGTKGPQLDGGVQASEIIALCNAKHNKPLLISQLRVFK